MPSTPPPWDRGAAGAKQGGTPSLRIQNAPNAGRHSAGIDLVHAPLRCANGLHATAGAGGTIGPDEDAFTGRGTAKSLAVVHSRTLDGMAAAAVSVEVHLSNGLPSFTNVDLQLHFSPGVSCRNPAQVATGGHRGIEELNRQTQRLAKQPKEPC